MQYLPAKIFFAGEIGAIALIIIIITRRHEQEIGGIAMLFTAIFVPCDDRPARRIAGPICRQHPVAKFDFRRDAIFSRRFVHIVPNGRAIGDGFFVQPWFEPISQRMHVAVRPDAGIAEQIPSPAHIGALFQYRKILVRALHGQMRCGTNARQPRTHNQHIKIGGHGLSCLTM